MEGKKGEESCLLSFVRYSRLTNGEGKIFIMIPAAGKTDAVGIDY